MQSLIRDMEHNMYAYMSYIPSIVPDMHVTDGAKALSIDAKVSSPTFNFICRSRFPDDTSIVQSIQQTLVPFAGREVSWWTAPACSPLDLPQHLSTAGLSFVGHYPGMVLQLSGDFRAQPVPHFSVREVRSLKDAKEFGRIAGQVYDNNPELGETYYQQGFKQRLNTSVFKMYLGRWHQKPVSTCIAFYHSRVVGIYSVATLAEAQKQGFGKAIVQHALHHAAKARIQTAILQSSSQGLHLYEKMGFKRVCDFDMWLPEH